ncbi:MAG: hypothetical protein F6K19_03575 [Cyanothece sp. SIO1E1]|nr:hypothetical protein [Cyanothece sp. SIO1E1]
MSKEIYFDRIESYVEGTNPLEEKRKFEKELEENPALKEEYQAYLATQEAVAALALDEIRTKVAKIAQSPPRSNKIFQLNRRSIAIAASFLLLIAVLSFLYGGQQYSDQSLFAQQYESPNWSSIRGSGTAPEKYDQAITSWQSGNLTEAILLLKEIKGEEEVFATAQYTLGHLQLQLEQAEHAVTTFENLLSLEDKRYQENVEWFLALAYLQAGNETFTNRQIGIMLQNDRHPYRQDALSLQVRLQSFWRRF